ncbi:hypothetical protein DEU56DRAFT_573527 [Suillus clintonianus]|uniref:uncharacterized protein n=1 Tax=Suillus clintonianus TaxID=1904413 RepID=UPI001B8814BD|nr:uncharacterized protein DEU56DRAFT_573527 [Suillus clintonianus]KAG2125395.1 hypothetical protein DEU56DRAFT_573527 [Suillus clintonianus]
MYRLHKSLCAPFYLFHATPPFHGATTFPDLMPGYVPSPESQVIVLEAHNAWPASIVIDMVIFSGKTLPSETPIEIPWSKWGPQYTYRFDFPHHLVHQISVFGSKIACVLPGHLTPELARTLEGQPCFYVHIWDFNKRVIARAENIHDPDSPIHLIHKSDDPDGSPPYIATVYRTPHPNHVFRKLFLEHDRLTLTWVGVLNYGFSDGLMGPNCSCKITRFIFKSFPLYRRSARTPRTRINISSRGWQGL